jgi:hypothetical protein
MIRTRRRILFVLAFIVGLFVGFRHDTRNGLSFRRSVSVNERLHSLVAHDDQPWPVDRASVPRRLHRKYLAEYTIKIDGWFNHEILYVIWTISQFQYQKLKVVGAIGEIGVHHGKFTCYLYLMRRYKEQILFAVDVFEKQSLNKDGSGNGQKDVFLRNIAAYAHMDSDDLTIYSGSSLDLNPIFAQREEPIKWWQKQVIEQRGIQLISVSRSIDEISHLSTVFRVKTTIYVSYVIGRDKNEQGVSYFSSLAFRSRSTAAIRHY